MKIIDVAKSISKDVEFKFIGIRPGEKLHEQMISVEDSFYTYSYNGYYKILPSINNWHLDRRRIKNGKPVASDFIYSSNNNDEWMTKTYLKNWIKKNKDLIGKF